MSTRSAILQKTKTGYRGIYCHHDGYVEHVGKILVNHYTDNKKLSALIDLGDLSTLGENPIQRFDGKYLTFAYGRDHGEDNTEAVTGKTIAEVASQIDHAHLYVFEDGKWTVDGESLDAMLLKLEE